MSWHCSRALVEEFSEAICLVGELSAPSSSTPTPEAYYWPDKTTEHSRLSLFGMTSEPLMADHGAELLTWFRGAFLARTSASPAKATDWMASEVGSGRKWLGLLARFNHDLRSWKTPQSSLVEGLDEFSETWPRWGSMRTGESWERITPELRTCGTDFGLWPTPCAQDSADRKVSPSMHETKNGTFKHRGKNGTLSQIRLSQVVKHMTPGGVGQMNPNWEEWLMGWPIGHTELQPLAMDKYREWQRQHSIYSADKDQK